MSDANEKKKLIIFLLVAYGVTYLMGIFMWYGNGTSADLSGFPVAQMLYPASGVMLACLLVHKGDQKIPKAFFWTFLLFTLGAVVLATLAVVAPGEMLSLNGMSMSIWGMILQFMLILGSIVGWITLLIAGRERREAYGLCWKNWKSSLLCVFLFLALYFLRAGISYVAEGQPGMLIEIVANPETWTYMVLLLVNFLLSFTVFFGEEYGWRYFLQPLLQKRFGLRLGVLALGVVWGVWHLPVDFFYYTTPDRGLIMLVSQIITCVSLGIFFAWAYMKTGNIWVPVLMHFFNNNLIMVIANEYSTDVLQNQEVTWGMLPGALLLNGVLFGLFLLAKEFRGKGEDALESQ